MKQLKTLAFAALVVTLFGLHQTVSATQMKTVESAQSIVLKDLGLKANQVRFKEVDFDKGIYEIDLVADNVEYDYDIQASTGKILKKKSKTLTVTKSTPTSTQPKKTTVAVTIAMEQAKTIALKDAGLTANEVRFKEVDLEKGVYEIEAIADDTKFDYKINGTTGQITKKKVELLTAGKR